MIALKIAFGSRRFLRYPKMLSLKCGVFRMIDEARSHARRLCLKDGVELNLEYESSYDDAGKLCSALLAMGDSFQLTWHALNRVQLLSYKVKKEVAI
ncbi:MAG: hypothetical protein H7A33_00900 [Deltaproteobacteria bacterium]|nr:hypothetical protein [Deltaproteobacteria bacterium]